MNSHTMNICFLECKVRRTKGIFENLTLFAVAYIEDG